MRAADAPDSASRLGWTLLGVLTLGVLPLGAVHPSAQAVVHFALCAATLHALSLAPRALGRAGRARSWLIGTAPLLAAVAVGLAPLPAALLSRIARAPADPRPLEGWAAISLDPVATVGELATLSAVLGFGALVCVWAVGRHRRSLATRAAVVGLLGLVVFAGAHAALGATSVLGVLTPSAPRSPFFAPLVNPNHTGTLIVLGVAVAAGVAADRRYRRAVWSRLAVVAVALGVALALWLGSPGTWLALAAMLAVALWRAQMPRGRRVGALMALAAAGATTLAVHLRLEPSWATSSAPMRLAQWGDQLGLIAGYPVFGAGGGTYEIAYAPFRTWPLYARVEHAHSDWLEWVVETGAIGVAAAGLCAALLWRGLGEREPRAWKWELGLFGVAVHAAVDFPLQILGVALAVAGAAAVRFAAYAPTVEIAVPTVRRWLVALALSQVLAGGWQVRTALVESAVRDVRGAATDLARAEAGGRRLERLAPRHPELALYEARRALAAGDRVRARERAMSVAYGRRVSPASAQRQAGLLLHAAGLQKETLAVLHRALRRDPNDYRTWLALSRVRATDATDPIPAAEALVEALRRWPYALSEGGAPLLEGWAMLPVGVWWVEALSDAPAWWSLYLGGQAMRRGDLETAMLAYDQAAVIDPDLRDWPSRARAVRALGRADEADALLRARLAREPGSAPTLWALADFHRADGRHAEARDTYLAAWAHSRTDARLLVEALRAAEAAEGPESARVLGERLALEGRSEPLLALERARLALALDAPRSCLELLAPRVLDDPVAGERARTLRARCHAACERCGDLP